MTMKTPFIKMQNKSYVLEGLGTAINGKHLCPQVHLMQYRGNILSEKAYAEQNVLWSPG